MAQICSKLGATDNRRFHIKIQSNSHIYGELNDLSVPQFLWHSGGKKQKRLNAEI
jgi:hypothetical protein